MLTGGTLYFLRNENTHHVVTDADFNANDFPGGYKPIQILPDGTMKLMSVDAIDTMPKFFKPIAVNTQASILTGDLYANTKKGYVYKSENDFGQLDSRLKVVAVPAQFTDQQIQDIISGKLKEGDSVTF